MKMFKLSLLGAALLGGLALAGPGAAQERVVVRHTTTVHHVVDRNPRWNGRHRVCTTRWHHHRRVRTCSVR